MSSQSYSGLGCLFTEGTAIEVVEACPDLQEISIRDKIGSVRIPIVSPQLPGIPRPIRLSVLRRLIPNQLNIYER